MSEHFVWSDAWILLAIIYTGKQGGDLQTIIGAADYINHAIPNEEELKGAFARLTEGEMIKEQNGKFKASAKVMKAYSRTHTERRAALKEFEDMEIFLASQNPA